MGDILKEYLSSDLLSSIQNVVVAVLVLLIGWFLASLISKGIKKWLDRAKVYKKTLNKFFPDSEESLANVNQIISRIIYYILLIMVLILFFNVLNLQIIAAPLADLVNSFFAFIPTVLKAGLILLLGFIVATILQWIVVNGGKKARLLDLLKKLNVADTEEKAEGYIKNAGKIVFYAILLVFIPGVLDAFNISGLSEPFSGLLSNILVFIPKLLAAAMMFAIGWFVAKVIKNIVENLLLSIGSEKAVEKMKLQDMFKNTSLALFVANVVFVLIMIPIVVSSLEKLELRGITEPAIGMLYQVAEMIPNIIVAALLILMGGWIGKFARQFVSNILEKVGFDNFMSTVKLGDEEIFGDKVIPSTVIGYIVQVLIVFFLTIQALYIIKLDFLVDIASAITAYLPNVLAAVLILVVALIIGNIAEKVVKNTLRGAASRALSLFAKYSILVLAIFMVLAQLGIAESIVSSAFILILGGLSLAFGLAFGLGGKDFAAKYLKKADEHIENMKGKKE